MSSEKEGCCHGSEKEHSQHAEHKPSCASEQGEQKMEHGNKEQREETTSAQKESEHKKDGGCCSH